MITRALGSDSRRSNWIKLLTVDFISHGFAAHITKFCRSLRQHGFITGPAEGADALRAMSLIDLMSPISVYWALRSVLLSDIHDVTTFDYLFNRFFDFNPPTVQYQHDSRKDLPGKAKVRTPSNLTSSIRHDLNSSDTFLELIRTGASAQRRNSTTDLTVLTSKGAGDISRVAERMIASLVSRPSRRMRPNRRGGSLDMRGVLRKSISHCGEPLQLPRKSRVKKYPRLLILLDASGSMDRRAGLMLELAHNLAQHSDRVETFVFTTTVTRVSAELRTQDFAEALRRIGKVVDHWSGGTKIGESLAYVNARYAGLQDRYTTVFLVSDGWDTGTPEKLGRELRRMRRRVHRLFWLNPLLGTEGYEQATRSLMAASDHIDSFISIRDFSQLKKLPALLNR